MKVTVDLSLAPQPPAMDAPEKLATLIFSFDPTAAPAAKRQCKAF